MKARRYSPPPYVLYSYEMKRKEAEEIPAKLQYMRESADRSMLCAGWRRTHLVSASVIQGIYLGFLALEIFVVILLNTMNVRHASSAIGKLPPQLSEMYGIEYQKKAFEYLLARVRPSVAQQVTSSIVLALITVTGFFGWLDGFLRGAASGSCAVGVLFFIAVSAIFTLTDLPFEAYRTFRVEEKFGFNCTTLPLWLKDHLKEICLGLVIGIPVLCAVLKIMETTGDAWWIYAVTFLSAVELLILFIYPTWIAPLFNKFERLEEGEPRESIERLAGKLRFSLSGIFRMDGSRRTMHGNAFFAGMGKSRRIVLFDTLLQQLNPEEICAVVAHEIGHARKLHILKMLLLSMASSFVVFYLCSRLLSNPAIYAAFGFQQSSPYAALIILFFAISPLGLLLSPLARIPSRRFEYEADRFAVLAIGGPEGLITALMKLSEKSLGNLTPHPLYSFVYYSHPALLERILAMREICHRRTP